MNTCKLCDKSVIGRGLCKLHYHAMLRNGTLKAFPVKNRSIQERMMEKIVISESGCWIWQGLKNGYGYGMIWKDGKSVKAHREMFRATNKDFDEAKIICHKCDIPACVNPAHLFQGTRLDNNRDCVSKGRSAAGMRSGLAKLTTDQISEIRLDTRTHQKIADDYGISQGHVSRVKNRSRRSSG